VEDIPDLFHPKKKYLPTLVILSFNYSEHLVSHFVKAGVPYIIYLNKDCEVDNDNMIQFFQLFYKYLCRHQNVAIAFNEAKNERNKQKFQLEKCKKNIAKRNVMQWNAIHNNNLN